MARNSQTEAAIAARRRASGHAVLRVQQAIVQQQDGGTRITVAGIAAAADVSRTFLYENPAARTLVTEAIRSAPRAESPPVTNDPDDSHSWKERAINAETQIHAAHNEIRQQRHRIGILLGQIRDLDQRLPPDAAQRLLSENTELRRQTHNLQQTNQELERRLTAARENNRFLDRRIAALEAETLETIHHNKASCPSGDDHTQQSGMPDIP